MKHLFIIVVVWVALAQGAQIEVQNNWMSTLIKNIKKDIHYIVNPLDEVKEELETMIEKNEKAQKQMDNEISEAEEKYSQVPNKCKIDFEKIQQLSSRADCLQLTVSLESAINLTIEIAWYTVSTTEEIDGLVDNLAACSSVPLTKRIQCFFDALGKIKEELPIIESAVSSYRQKIVAAAEEIRDETILCLGGKTSTLRSLHESTERGVLCALNKHSETT